MLAPRTRSHQPPFHPVPTNALYHTSPPLPLDPDPTRHPLHPETNPHPPHSSKTKTSTAAPAAKPATANAITRLNPLFPPPPRKPPTPATPAARSSTPSARPACAAPAATSVGPGRVSAARRTGASRSGGSAHEEGRGIEFWIGGLWSRVGWKCGEVRINSKRKGGSRRRLYARRRNLVPGYVERM